MNKPNVAIILAVDAYDRLTPLPACRRDAAVVKSIITATGRFQPEHVLCIDSDTSSGRVKGQLAVFLKDLEAVEIDSLLFYYSGHGLFNGEFHYLFSDFDEAKRRQTSLTNTELDDMLRSKNPTLAIKIVDACQSGQDYVKSRESFEKALNETGSRYRSCYFLFSSSQTQNSFASSEISYFTLQLAKSIESHPADAIRYKDIIDFLSDEFDGNQEQQPFFVTQAKHTEVFTQLTDPLRETIRKLLPTPVAQNADGNLVPATTTTAGPPLTPAALPLAVRLREVVEKEAAQYCHEAEAFDRYDHLLLSIEQAPATEPLDDLYNRKITPRNEYSVPSSETLGEWANANQSHYFVKPTLRPEEYKTWEPRRSANPVSLLAATITSTLEYFRDMQEVTRIRHVPSGIESTIAKPPYKSILIEFEPKLQNLPWWHIWFAVVNSKTHMRVFYALALLRELNWNERTPPEKVEWRVAEAPLKDERAVRSLATNAISQLTQEMVDHLATRFRISDGATPQLR